MNEFKNDLMSEKERRNYLFLQGFYLKVKDEIAKLERNLNLPDDQEEQS